MVARFRTSARWSIASALIAGSLLFMINTACGILGIGVALPAAIGSNSNFSIKGELVDRAGIPLDQVQIHEDHSHVYWDAITGTTTKDESKTVVVNKKFDYGWIRGSHVALIFSKAGYSDTRIEMLEDGYAQPTATGTIWPKGHPFRVVMRKSDDPGASLRKGTVTLSYTKAGDPNSIQLLSPSGPSGVNFDGADPSKAPADTMYAEVEKQLLVTSGLEHRVDPLDVELPAKVTLHISAADGGFVRFVPIPGTPPLDQMATAPASGYEPALTLDGKRLRQMREKGDTYIVDGHEYFYFRSNGKFGKAAVSWARPQNQPECRLTFQVSVQPDGSANLASFDNAR